MNIAGNMAGFYIAQQIGIDGPQLAIARRHAGLEAALELLQLPTPTHRHALPGCFEAGVWQLEAPSQRVGLPKDAAEFVNGDRCYWAYAGRARSDEFLAYVRIVPVHLNGRGSTKTT